MVGEDVAPWLSPRLRSAWAYLGHGRNNAPVVHLRPSTWRAMEGLEREGGDLDALPADLEELLERSLVHEHFWPAIARWAKQHAVRDLWDLKGCFDDLVKDVGLPKYIAKCLREKAGWPPAPATPPPSPSSKERGRRGKRASSWHVCAPE